MKFSGTVRRFPQETAFPSLKLVIWDRHSRRNEMIYENTLKEIATATESRTHPMLPLQLCLYDTHSSSATTCFQVPNFASQVFLAKRTHDESPIF